MKIIVVPTDFSAPAEDAMLYAGQLAETINASIILFHVFQMPVSMTEVPVLMVSVEEIRKTVDDRLQKAKDLLQSHCPTLIIETQSKPGDVADELKEVCEILRPFAIVTGRHGASGIENVLFGSTSLSIIRSAAMPVIVVPPLSSAGRIRNIGLAVDIPDENFPAEQIKRIAGEFRAPLHVIHVQKDSFEKSAVPMVPGLDAIYSTVHDTELVHGIESFIEKNQIDLLILLPHRHNLIERLFSKMHTPELIKKLSIPVMCIRES